MSRATLAALLVTAVVLPEQDARAQEDDGTGWFTTFQLGSSDYDVTLEGDGLWWGRVDDGGEALAFGIGYDWLPALGFRFMYEHDGGIAAGNLCPPGEVCPAVTFRESTDADAWSLVAMPRLRFGNGWEAYGTLGALHWSIRPKGELPRDHDTALIYGGGLGYRLDSGLGFALEYQRADSDYDALRLNASFRY